MSTKISNSAKSWINVSENSDFPIQNIPFGTFKSNSKSPRVGSAIGDYVLDLKELFELGYLSNLGFELEDFDYQYLNNMMRKGKTGARKLRERIYDLLLNSNAELQAKTEHHEKVLDRAI